MVARWTVLCCLLVLEYVQGVSLVDKHCFATKTVYWDQRRVSKNVKQHPSSKSMQLVQTQLVVRHGTRYPTTDSMKGMEDLVAKLHSSGAKLPQWLQAYQLPFNQSMSGALADVGHHELAHLAQRHLQALGLRAPQNYSNGMYRLSHTYVQRTGDSAHAFADAYFQNSKDVQFEQKAKGKDRLLRFFDDCKRYKLSVDQNTSALIEQSRFQNTTLVQHGVKKLAKALNLNSTSSTTLTVADLKAVYSACAFDIALYQDSKHWCSLLDESVLQMMEYNEDLEAFYQQGAGYAINYEMSAVLLQDIMATIDARINGSTSRFGDFRFAHAETVLPLATLLGFGSRKPLLATESLRAINTRGFRTSILSPFASNIELRLYQDTRSKKNSKYFVQVLVNERDDIVVPGCDQTFCDLDHVKRLWAPYLECNFDAQCRV